MSAITAGTVASVGFVEIFYEKAGVDSPIEPILLLGAYLSCILCIVRRFTPLSDAPRYVPTFYAIFWQRCFWCANMAVTLTPRIINENKRLPFAY